ncbi:hypothetical protein D3C81_1475660 [compost metagenome]
MASEPYSAERAPRTTSTRSICCGSRNSRLVVPLEAEAMRWPSTSTRVWALLVPRISTLVRLPVPPVRLTVTPGTRSSSSPTLRGCRRSMSWRVKTVVAAVALGSGSA